MEAALTAGCGLSVQDHTLYHAQEKTISIHYERLLEGKGKKATAVFFSFQVYKLLRKKKQTNQKTKWQEGEDNRNMWVRL